MKRVNKLLLLSVCGAGLLAGTSAAMADDYSVMGRKVIYLKETGSGVEGKHAAIKLDNAESLEPGCFEDILLLDASTAEGKAQFTSLEALQASGTVLKSISYTRDEEGDCYLKKFEK